MGWMKELVYQTKSETREQLLRRIENASALIRESRVQLGNATRHSHQVEQVH